MEAAASASSSASEAKKINDYLIFCTGDDPRTDDEIFNDGLHEMTEEEEKRYYAQLRETDGFEIDYFPNVFKGDIIAPYPAGYDLDILAEVTDIAIKDHKDKTGENLEVIDYVRLNAQAASPMNFYITFDARSDRTNQTKTYETKVRGRVPLERSDIPIFREQRKKGAAPEKDVPEKRTNDEHTTSSVVDAKKQKLEETLTVCCCSASDMKE